MLFVLLMAKRSQIIALKNWVKLLHVCCNLMRVKLTVRPTLGANAIANTRHEQELFRHRRRWWQDCKMLWVDRRWKVVNKIINLLALSRKQMFPYRCPLRTIPSPYRYNSTTP
ncbi:hypothetical protein [Chlorogloeopsis sp. ULAP02]|uniref:hypothetical protein n=1 Tax=Chlorogloeopsis sp. ULAP02 TaxID=3107926 RepID=UPI0031363383